MLTRLQQLSSYVSESDSGDLKIDSTILRALWKMAGSSAVTGDLLQSSAPVDPLFWIIHPSIERVWQWKRLSSCPYEYSWASGSSVYSQCSGHDAEDVLPFSEMTAQSSHTAGSGQFSDLTNAEIYALLDPTDNAMNYIYDSFEWSHCSEEGIEIRTSCGSGDEAGDSDSAELVSSPVEDTVVVDEATPSSDTRSSKVSSAASKRTVTAHFGRR